MAAGSSLRSLGDAVGGEVMLYSGLADKLWKSQMALWVLRETEREGHIMEIIHRNKMQKQKEKII